MIVRVCKYIFIFLIPAICCQISLAYEYDGPSQFWQVNIRDHEVTTDATSYMKGFECFDLAELWLQHQNAMLGSLGSNHQRFYIHFEKIQKNRLSSKLYLVSGKTKVKNNINDFEGKIKILHVYGMNQKIKKLKKQEYSQALQEHDTDTVKRYKANRFLVVGRYTFRENAMQASSGVLEGIVHTYIYCENGKIFYDDLNLGWSDNYANNLFVGTWKSYKNSVIKRCNFGNFRIPQSGDLDIGVGKFSPNEKYLSNGWKTYSEAHWKRDGKALEEEKKPWWLRMSRK